MNGQHARKTWLVIVGFTLLWMALAVWRPETTWHLAPGIIAVAPLLAKSGDVPLRRASGLAVALATAGILGLSGQLRGPSLLPWGDATLEAIVVGMVGWGVGMVVVRRGTVGQQPQ